MTNLKIIIEILKIMLNAYKWMRGEISESDFRKSIKKRRDLRESYISGSKEDKLKSLMELQK